MVASDRDEFIQDSKLHVLRARSVAVPIAFSNAWRVSVLTFFGIVASLGPLLIADFRYG
jgi:hypothetical protein